jgi:hypothetical protein
VYPAPPTHLIELCDGVQVHIVDQMSQVGHLLENRRTLRTRQKIQMDRSELSAKVTHCLQRTHLHIGVERVLSVMNRAVTVMEHEVTGRWNKRGNGGNSTTSSDQGTQRRQMIKEFDNGK